MKKTIWLVILVITFTMKVEASDIYYTEYSDYTDYQEEDVIESDLISVDKQTRYLWYEETKTLGPPKLYNEREELSNDCYTVVSPNWQQGIPPGLDGTTYETRIRYDYVLQEEIRYIHLYNLLGNANFKLTELHVLINDEEINYEYECVGCSFNFKQNIKNNKFDDDIYIENGGHLIIDLNKSYPLDQIKIDFYIFDQGKNDKIYTLGFSKDKNVLFDATHVLKNNEYDWNVPQNFNIDIFNSLIPKEKWTYEKTVYQFMLNDLVISFAKFSEYRYTQKLCKTYKYVREYNDEYTVNSVGKYTNKDESKSKVFYRYKTRNKIEIDLTEINELDFNLNNFVKYSSGEYKIIDNINWNKNGKYQVTFLIDNLVINKEVLLNIKDIMIEELNNKIKDLNEEIEKNKSNYKFNIENYQLKIKEIEDNYKNLNSVSQQIKEQKNYCEEEKQKLNSNILALNEQINYKLNPQIFSLQKLNNFYKNKVEELEDDIKILNSNVKTSTITKDNQIKTLEQELVLCENLKEDYKKVQNEVVEQQKNNDETNSKYNYVLKINYSNEIIIISFGILIIVGTIIYLIKIIRKKSNEKKV